MCVNVGKREFYSVVLKHRHVVPDGFWDPLKCKGALKGCSVVSRLSKSVINGSDLEKKNTFAGKKTTPSVPN